MFLIYFHNNTKYYVHLVFLVFLYFLYKIDYLFIIIYIIL